MNNQTLHIANLTVAVSYRPVKHLHLSVHPPHGEVRATVPDQASEDKVRRFILSRLAWVRRQQREFAAIPRKEELQYRDGETVFLWGRAYRLQIVETAGKHEVVQRGDSLQLHVRAGTERAGRKRALYHHYRAAITAELPHVRERWEAATGLTASEYRIKYMRTKWGSCTVADRRVWLNVELAKHPHACLSYIVLHELLHLQEREHTPEFRALLSRFMPGWEQVREELNTGFPGLPGLG